MLNKFDEYAATVVRLGPITPLPNCDTLRGTLVFGQMVLVGGTEYKEGDLVIYFPLETQINDDVLSHHNLYSSADKNVDTTKRGFFGNNGRVRAIKLRGYMSHGFVMPLEDIAIFSPTDAVLSEGDEFNEFRHGDFNWVLCKKYVVKRNPPALAKNQKPKPKLADLIVENQFQFHYKTTQLYKNIERIYTDHILDITKKLHGTSVVVGNLLVNKKLSRFERFLQWCGVDIENVEYKKVWSSRMVIKGVGEDWKTRSNHFYKEDIWGVVASEINNLPEGVTVYAEIVGFTPSGSAIQEGYDYGCAANQHKTYVYRVTVTGGDGEVFELPPVQMRDFCNASGFTPVPCLFHGTARDLTPGSVEDTSMPSGLVSWQDELFKKIYELYVTGKNDPTCVNNVPEEGVVIRLDQEYHESQAFKAKSEAFYQRETKMLDEGKEDMEEIGEEAA